jgi:uncharacterized membrane protein YhaH (DUF805 family)
MPNDLALKALSYGLIWFSLLMLLVALLVSQRHEYTGGQASKNIFPFTIAMIGLWALIALGIIYTQGDKTNTFGLRPHRGESQIGIAISARF